MVLEINKEIDHVYIRNPDTLELPATPHLWVLPRPRRVERTRVQFMVFGPTGHHGLHQPVRPTVRCTSDDAVQTLLPTTVELIAKLMEM